MRYIWVTSPDLRYNGMLGTSRDHKIARSIKRVNLEERIHNDNLFFKKRNKSFSGLKVKKFNKVHVVSVNVNGDEYIVYVAVNRNNAIYDIWMANFGRLTNLYYSLYGHSFNKEKVYERIYWEFKD